MWRLNNSEDEYEEYRVFQGDQVVVRDHRAYVGIDSSEFEFGAIKCVS